MAANHDDSDGVGAVGHLVMAWLCGPATAGFFPTLLHLQRRRLKLPLNRRRRARIKALVSLSEV